MSRTPKLDAMGGKWFNDHDDALKWEHLLGDYFIHLPTVWGQRNLTAMDGQMPMSIWIHDPMLTEGGDELVCEMEVRWVDSYGTRHSVDPGFRVYLDELDAIAQRLEKLDVVLKQEVKYVLSQLTNPSEQEGNS